MAILIGDVASARIPTRSNLASFKIEDWELDAQWFKITNADNDRVQTAAINNATNFVLGRLDIKLDASHIEAAENVTLVGLLQGKTKISTDQERAALIKAAFKTKGGSRTTDILRNAEQFKNVFLTKLIANKKLS